MSYFGQPSKAVSPAKRNFYGLRFETSKSPSVYEPRGLGFLHKFRLAYQDWTNESAVTSSLSDITGNANYRSIVEMGRPAIPLIVGKLADEPSLLFLAIAEITEEMIDDPESGDIEEACTAWISWAKNNGLDNGVAN